jgi:ribosome-associated toxin RatA of RatAB toxin-antitoxin module
VVVDVKAPADIVFNALANFEDYKSMIPTVRNVDVLSISEKSGTEVRTESKSTTNIDASPLDS